MIDGHDWAFCIKLLLVVSVGIATALLMASEQPVLTVLNLALSFLFGVCAAFALACLIATQDMDR